MKMSKRIESGRDEVRVELEQARLKYKEIEDNPDNYAEVELFIAWHKVCEAEAKLKAALS